jgi:septum formation protein
MKTLILASGSKSRKKLLENAGIHFEIIPSTYEEDMSLDMDGASMAELFSKEKASDVASKVENSIVIGADSVVIFEDEVIGKPHTEKRAKETLMKLRGRWHSVVTGFTIIDTENEKLITSSVETRVKLREFDELTINAYIRSGEPLDKAGGYSEDKGSVIIEVMEGDIFNVQGLPIPTIFNLLLYEFDYKYWMHWSN